MTAVYVVAAVAIMLAYGLLMLRQFRRDRARAEHERKMRELREAMNRVSLTIGEALIPTFRKLTVSMDEAAEAMRKFCAAFTRKENH